MTQFDHAQVEADLTTLHEAFSYDPPEQWLAAYHRLKPVAAYLAVARRAYRWVLLIGLVIFLAAVVAQFWMLPSLIEGSNWAWFGLLALVVLSASDLAASLARWLAQRREPLLKLQGQIDGNLAKFKERAEAHNSTMHHVPA